MKNYILLFVAAISLTACVTPTKVLQALPEEQKGSLNIQSVSVTYSDLSRDQIILLDEKAQERAETADSPNEIQYKTLETSLETIVKEYLEGIDSDGLSNANVKIEIDNLKFANAAAALLVGDTDQLAGTVRVYNAQSKQLVSEFYVDVLKGTGGLLGLAIRGGGVREKLANDFAIHIGNELGFEKPQS